MTSVGARKSHSADRPEPAGSTVAGGAFARQRITPSQFASGNDLLASRWSTRREVGGLHFVPAAPERAALDVVDAATRPGRTIGEHIHLANAYTIALAAKAPGVLANVLSAPAWNLPDGKPISLVSRLRGDSPRLEQVRGPQFFLDVCEYGQPARLRHYLLGSAPEVLDRLRANLERQFPGILIVGADSPPFRTPTDQELDDRDALIRASGAQVVWVGLGTPKQDLEAARLAAGLPVIAIAIGAGFDYAAGTLAHAPKWVTAVGLEWLFRLLMEPRRLWRRYLFGNVEFIVAVLRHGRPGHRNSGG